MNTGQFSMNAELLSSICAALLSLAASYIPGFAPWYAALDGTLKRLLMLALLALTALGCYGLACAGLGETFNLELSCDQSGLILLVRLFLAALMSSQATFLISKRGSL